MILKRFFDISTGFRFSKISVCSVHFCSCPWLRHVKDRFVRNVNHDERTKNPLTKHNLKIVIPESESTCLAGFLAKGFLFLFRFFLEPSSDSESDDSTTGFGLFFFISEDLSSTVPVLGLAPKKFRISYDRKLISMQNLLLNSNEICSCIIFHRSLTKFVSHHFDEKIVEPWEYFLCIQRWD